MNCKNCNHEITENFCSNCGQQVALKRINSHYISHELFHLFHLEKGFLYNFKQLILRPATTIRVFIKEDRSKHMKPIGFLIFCAILYTFIYKYYKPISTEPIEKSYFEGSTVETIQHWIDHNFGYTYILKSFFVAGCAYFFFKKYCYNYFEIMTLLCFVSGEGMLIIGMMLPFHKYLSQNVNTILLLSTTILYPTIVIAQFFDRKKPINYVKSLLAYFIGNIAFFALVVAVGLSIDFIKNLF